MFGFGCSFARNFVVCRENSIGLRDLAQFNAFVRLNLGCWIFYREGWINIDHDRSVRADRYEDAVTLPSFGPNSVDEIYAGHIAEHVDDVRAAFTRWREILKPGGRITITVPDCRGANRLWLEGKRFPALEAEPNEGILEITTGIKPADLRGRNPEGLLHKRVFDESTLRICMEAAGFVQVRSVDDHEIMVAPCSALGWQIALEGFKPRRAWWSNRGRGSKRNISERKT
jgi:SAM-dependent methyltransferase